MNRLRLRVGMFVALLLGWIAVSDQRNVTFIAMGAVSAAVVVALTASAVATVIGPGTEPLGRFVVRMYHGAVYVVWLLWRIFVAGFQVAVVVLRRDMPLEPCELRFRTNMQSRLAQVVLANSITLTPGTLTISVDDGEFLVHAMSPELAEDFLDGRMQRRVARAFGDIPDDAIDVHWTTPPEVRD